MKKKLLPNYLLRDERARHNWTLKDVADRIDAPDSATVGRWERGVTFPQPHYRQRLCEIYEKEPAELGLVLPSKRDGALVQTEAPRVSDEVSIPSERPASPLSAQSAHVHINRIKHIYNVPAAFTSFVGRQQEVEEVCALLTDDAVRMVTLLGSGGIGKTRLAMQVAEQLRNHFVNGVCYVALASITNASLVLSALAQALEIEQESGLQLAEQVKHLLQDRHLLLLFDSFEQVKEAAPLLDELLAACAGLKILATSRVVLHLQAEYEYTVKPLAVPDLASLTREAGVGQLQEYAALELFVQRARAHMRNFRVTEQNMHALVELCHRLDGLPLAIELAAARSKLLTPQQLLEQSPQLLKSPLATVPERQRNLYNLVKWSYDLLQPSEQWLFRHCAVFAGPFSLALVSSLLAPLATEPLNSDEGVAALLDSSLLQRYEGADDECSRFTMLETMREFGYICLRENGELERCQREHALYYLTLVEQAVPELKSHKQMEWLQRLELEGENLRAAQQWLVKQGETILALRFAEACGKFYGLRGYWGEEWYWLRAVLALPLPADLQEGRAIRARVLRRAGHLAYRLRHLNEARQWQQESVRLSRAVDDQVNLAGALSGLAWTIYRQQEEAALTDQYLQESLVAARASGDRWCLANTLESIGRYEYYQGDYAVAHALLDESVQLAREIGDRESLARILTTAILIELSEQHLEQAERLTDESMRLAHELGTRPLIALILDRRIDIALARKDYARAAMLCQERIDIAQELGDHPTVAHKYLQLGEIALTQARPRSALVYAQNALKLFQEQHDCPNITATQTLLAAIASSSSSE